MKITTVFIIIFCCFLLSNCRFQQGDFNNYYLTIKFSPGDKNTELKGVSAIIGSDKFWWSEIAPGEEKIITLSTKKNPVINLVLLYSIDGQEKDWESDNLLEDADYRFFLEIDAAGTVKERFCRLPCEL